MITIVPEFLSDTDEYQAAIALKEKLISHYPDLETSKEKVIKMIVEPRLNASGIFSVDIVMIGYFGQPISVKSSNAFPFEKRIVLENHNEAIDVFFPSVNINSFVTCVEVKAIDPRKLKKDETGHIVFSTGDNKIKNISMQNKKQVDGLANHIYKSIKTTDIRTPYISGFMFLTTLDRSNNLNDPGVIHSESNGADILRAIALHQINGRTPRRLVGGKFEQPSKDAKENNNIPIFSFSKAEARYYLEAEFFSTPEAPTQIDLKRMNTIAKDRISQDWIDDVGKKLLIFQGLGGTAKTIRMLQLAHKKYSENGANVLILTYNWALISNLNRLMAIMGISPHDDERGGIRIASLEGFMFKLYQEYELLPTPEEIKTKGWKSVHLELSQTFAKLFESGAIDNIETLELLELDFDYCFVDEGQDWTLDEQKIIKAIFGENNIVVAHGKAQNIRANELHWNRASAEENYRIVRTRKALRMKSNLATFVKRFANEALKNNEFDTLIKDDESLGGHIYIVIGDYFKDLSIHNQIISNHSENIQTIDNLFCIQNSSIADTYRENVGEIWEGFKEDNRRIQPNKLSQARFINYKSCRGLEGWTTFNFQFDKFWEAQISEGQKAFENDTNKNLLDDPDTFANDYAAKWALIAFTRSIDSMVIHLEDKNSSIAKKLIDIQKRSSGSIDLIEIG